MLQGSGCGSVGRRGVGRGTTPPLPAHVRSVMQPFIAEDLCLLLDQLHSFLLIWLVLEQDPRDHQPQPGLQALAFGPVQKLVWQRFSACWWAILLSMYWSVCHFQVRRTASSLIHRKGCSRLERSELGSTSSIAASTSALNEGPGFPTVHAFTTRSPWW